MISSYLHIYYEHSTPLLVHAGLWYGNGRARLRDGDRNRGKNKARKETCARFPIFGGLFLPRKEQCEGAISGISFCSFSSPPKLAYPFFVHLVLKVISVEVQFYCACACLKRNKFALSICKPLSICFMQHTRM